MSKDKLELDDRLEQLQPPAAILSALTPPSTLSVSALLALAVPSQPGSRKIALQGLAWFSKNTPLEEHVPHSIEDLILPSPRLCRTLEDFLRPALENNLTSVEHPTKDGVHLPLWSVRAFKWANRLLQSQRFWRERLQWVDTMAEREEWAVGQREQTRRAIMDSPWQAGIHALQRGGVAVNHLARILLSDEWVTGDTFDCMLDVARARFHENNVDATLRIAEASLCQGIEGGGSSRVVYWGGELRDGHVKRLLLPWNIPKLHWLLFEIDVSTSCIKIGDSKPRISKAYISEILLALRQWLDEYLPGQHFILQEGINGLDIEEQQDSFSCGVASPSKVLKIGCPLLPDWSPSKPFEMRAYFFASCINLGRDEIDHPDLATSSSSPTTTAANPEPEPRQDRYLRTCEYYEASSLISTTTSDSDTESDDESGYTTPDPIQLKVKRVSTAKKDTAVHRTEKSVKQKSTSGDPEWWSDPKFTTFQRKIYALETKFAPEFHRQRRDTVICGRCNKSITARAEKPYGVEFFKSHLKSKACLSSGGHQKGIMAFMQTETTRRPSALQACPGLSDIHHSRISTYLARTVVLHGGAPHRSALVKRFLEANPKLKTGSKKLGDLVNLAERAEAKWSNDHIAGVVFSVDCLRNISVPAGGLPSPCFPCLQVLAARAFKNALRRRTPDASKVKFTPHAYRNSLLGEAFARHLDVHELLLTPQGQRWKELGIRATKGRYEGYNVFLGLIQATMSMEDRLFRGKGLQNMKYDTDFDTMCTNAALMSPRVYRMLQAELGGRSIRSIQQQTAKAGRFQVGIIDANFDSAKEWVEQSGYVGPLVLSVDDTKLTPALEPYKDGGVWKVAGIHGESRVFNDYDELIELSDIDRSMLAEKVRAWFLVIPIPGVPPKLLATLPICSKVDQEEIRGWHHEIEERLAERSMHYVSYNVDGASVERGFGHVLENSASATHTWDFDHPLPNRPPLKLIAPLLSNGQPRVIGTDGKHLKKNGRGSATSGARVLALGNYLVHYGHLADLAESKNSPLLKTDIIGVDKQDDRAAARLFSSAVIQQVSDTQPDALGLAIFLFIIGEIVDAQQSRTLTHIERIQMLWRGRFFLEGWRNYVDSHPHYNVNTHFITRELYDIISIFINAMLLLILTHRDYFPDVPLCLWLHSTEVCEHFYGCARQIQANYTAKQWIMMLPKIVMLMHGQMRRSKGMQADSDQHRSGYHHSWFESKGIDAVNLATFPSNADFQSALDTAYFEAEKLLNILGITDAGDDMALKDAREIPAFQQAFLQFQGNTTADLTLEDDDLDIIKVPSAKDILAIDGQDSTRGVSVSRLYEKEMANFGSAVIAETMHNDLRIDELAEHGDAEVKEWAAAIAEIAEQLKVHRASFVDNPLNHPVLLASDRQSAIKRAKAAALNFGTTTSFNFKTLIDQRKLHETHEATSAIAHRFRNAITTTEIIGQATQSSREDEKAETPLLDPQVISQMARMVSQSLVGGKKLDTAGLERKARWKLVGLSGDLEDVDLAIPHDEIEASNRRRQVYIDARANYADIEKKSTPILPTTGNINPFHTLRPSSWVLVYFDKKVFVGQVKVIYVEGGGKTPSHNFTPACSSIYSISRLVVQLYVLYAGTHYSPLVAVPKGRDSAVSYAFLHQANLICSLDFISPIMEKESQVEFSPGVYMFRPTLPMRILMESITIHIPEMMAAARRVLEACNSRKKRGAVENEPGEGPTKRSRTS